MHFSLALSGLIRSSKRKQFAILPDLPEPSYLTSIRSITFTPQGDEAILKTLKTGIASCPDSLNDRILKEESNELSSPLCFLSLRNFPSPYTDINVNVTPVHKKGDLSLVTNNRYISLLNSVAKLFEKLVFKYLNNHLRENNEVSYLH